MVWYNSFVHHNLFEWVLKVMPLEWFKILKEYEIGNDYFLCDVGWVYANLVEVLGHNIITIL